ncbi:rab3 gtpase-activating protein catalytic subunit [Holotrichia oblita]|uniref:Rab3 gtpase-activating protein catalytic subunit n=1 Tax=Holotrichia oblita TaxID=644536 RepID=A0ACB9TBV0_HOLOL|nr:rab3 gtpase-activating protein catalytic subunit [Holotrichia oblita]
MQSKYIFYLYSRLTPGFPDPRTCLLHQKLQMLNYCIERKISREAKLSSSGRSFESVEDTSTDDEEFYDCDIENDEANGKNRENYSLWNQPIGRLSKFKNLKLLITGEDLYIPVTQDPGPKTEDQLQEDTDFLLKLGSDPQGSELRAKMMSASLLSDMESFKAANPGSILEDFIRWYSPRDWIEDGEEVDEWGQKKGHLSSRMLISDNTWVEMWESAKPVPANRQRRLFDDTREAEKVLHFLDSRNLAEIAELLLPILFHTSIYRLVEECEQIRVLENSDILRQIIKTGERISRDGGVPKRRCELLIQEIAAVELSISQINSLLYKFNPAGEYDERLANFVENLTKGVEMEVADKFHSKTGENLLAMFSEAQKVANMILAEYGTVESDNQLAENAIFPQPAEREFVMRVSTCRPAVYSAKSPQFLRAILSKNEFRLCGAFSEDIVFF